MRRYMPGIVTAAVALFLIGLLVWAWMHAEWLGHSAGHDLIVGLVGGLLGALVTILLVWVAWEQLSAVSRTTSADFVLRLKRDFFSPETRTLVSLVANRWVRFVEVDASGNEADIPYLAVQLGAIRNARLPDDVKARLSHPATYTAFEVDDLLLGPLDDVATLWEAGTLQTEQIRDVFGWYIELAWDTPEIKAYIDHQQREEDPEIYAALGRLREKLRS